VDERKVNSANADYRGRGFSLVEMLIVVAITFIIAAMAVFQLQPALASARADTAMKEVIDQLRQAREYSIANRRYIQVTFPVKIVNGQTQYQVQITQVNAPPLGPGGANVVLSTVSIQGPLTFYVNPLLPDTPDGYGKANAIEFEGTDNGPAAGMVFQSDGEFVDAGTLLPINGTVFLGVPGQMPMSRAVTVLGSTGRVRGWKAPSINGWVQF
jgi:prepilin-type N-terminal cleavage/methylation domain-containing protein